MTLLEDLAKSQLDLQQETHDLLLHWGRPNGVVGPRPRARKGISFEGETSKTQQSFKDECDINNIMAKYRKAGEMTHVNENQPRYGEFSSGLDFKSANDQVLEAKHDFDGLSARIRARFNNNPAELLDFISDEANLKEAVEIGLIPNLDPPTDGDPEPTPPADPPPTGDAASVGDPPPTP